MLSAPGMVAINMAMKLSLTGSNPERPSLIRSAVVRAPLPGSALQTGLLRGSQPLSLRQLTLWARNAR